MDKSSTRRTRRRARMGHDHGHVRRDRGPIGRHGRASIADDAQPGTVSRWRLNRSEQGVAVVEFVLVMTLLIPLVLGIAQLALVLHVRNTLAAAASEGARAAAPIGATPADGVAQTRRMIRQTLADRYAANVSARWTSVRGVPTAQVDVRARVPALGLFGPSVAVTVRGHAVRELEP